MRLGVVSGKNILLCYFLEHAKVYGFIRGLNLPLFLSIKHLIETGSTFLQVFYHTKTIERACIELYIFGGNRPYTQYSVTVILFRGRVPSNRGKHHYNPIKFVQVPPQVISNFQVVDRFLDRHHGVFGLGLQAMAVNLGQQVHVLVSPKDRCLQQRG